MGAALMFVKVFSQILDSSIAEDYLVRFVFEDFLKLADKEGLVDMTPGAISRRTHVPLEIVTHGIEKLSLPDPESRSPDEEGRRIVLIDSHRSWGWRVVNYPYYRNIRDEEARRTYFRERKREQRAASRNVQDSPRQSNSVHTGPTVSTKAEAEAEAEADLKNIPAKGKPSRFSLPEWISEATWKDFEEMRSRKRAPLTPRARQGIVDDLTKIKAAGDDPEQVLLKSIKNSWSGVFPHGASGAPFLAKPRKATDGMRFANEAIQ
jgi:hypothetical protein